MANVFVIFLVIGVLAIVVGGCVMAFGAKKPSRLAAWASSYLVLIEGIVQLGLVASWLRFGRPSYSLALAAFIIYNLGNDCVLLGTIYKPRLKHYSLVVNCGGVMLALAMILLLISIRHLGVTWPLTGFIALVVVILVSMPIGLFVSARRRPGVAVSRKHSS